MGCAEFFRHSFFYSPIGAKVKESLMTTIFWASDSTVARKTITAYPETGIGQMFDRYVKKMDVQIENYAENGRSTKQFLDEGRLMPIYDRMHEGDFLFVQFGHNDEKQEDPARYTEPDGEFTANLERFANAARNKGAIPVFITPLTRRLYREPGMSHAAYSEAMRRAAKRMDVALIDLNASSEALVCKQGEAAKAYYMNFPAGIYPNYPEGKNDNTHLRPEGALVFGGLIARALYELGGVYAALLSEECKAWIKQEENT